MSTSIKKLLASLLTVVIVFSVMPNVVSAKGETPDAETMSYSQQSEDKTNYYNGEGPNKDWYTNGPATDGNYHISTMADLMGLAELVNTKKTNFSGQTIVLDNDIVLNQGDASTWGENAEGLYSWTPIGNTTSSYGYNNHFAGTFDGKGNSISGLYSKRVCYNGFIVYAMNATIQNLAIINSYFENDGSSGSNGAQYLGSVVAAGYGVTLKNIYSNAMVVSSHKDNCTGGIIGYAKSSNTFQKEDFGVSIVDSVVFAGTIRSDLNTGNNMVGGIMGSTNGSYANIKNCLFAGELYSNDNAVGGIAGRIGTDKATHSFDDVTKDNVYGSLVSNNLVAGKMVLSGKNAQGAVIGQSLNSSYSYVADKYVQYNYYDSAYELLCVGKGTDYKERNTVEVDNNGVTSEEMMGSGVLAKGGKLANLGDAWSETSGLPVPTGVKAIYEKHTGTNTEHTDDNKDHACDECGAEVGEHADSDDADHKCDYCGQVVASADNTLKFNKKGISFQSYIGLQPTILKSVVEGFEKVYVMADDEELDGLLYQDSVYVFDKKIVSTGMAEEITFTVYGEKGGKLYKGEEFTTSLAALALTKIEAFAAAGKTEHCTMLVDMLNYGAEAQKKYTPEATVLANANLGDYASYASADVLNLNKETTTEGEGDVVVKDFKLSLQSVLEINLTFAQDMSGYTAKVTVNGAPEEYGFEPLGDNYVLRIPVGAMLVHEDVVVAVCDSNGAQVSPTYTCSVESIAKDRIKDDSVAELVTAMMRYCEAVISAFVE